MSVPRELWSSLSDEERERRERAAAEHGAIPVRWVSREELDLIYGGPPTSDKEML